MPISIRRRKGEGKERKGGGGGVFMKCRRGKMECSTYVVRLREGVRYI